MNTSCVDDCEICLGDACALCKPGFWLRDDLCSEDNCAERINGACTACAQGFTLDGVECSEGGLSTSVDVL